MLKRILCLLCTTAGLLGIVACVVSIYAVWQVKARIHMASNRTVEIGDELVVVVRERLTLAKERVRALKITTADIEDRAKAWATQDARARVASRFGMEQQAARLETGLLQTDQWLEMAETGLKFVGLALEEARLAGATLPNFQEERLVTELASARVLMANAAQQVKEIADGGGAAGEWTEAKLQQVLRLVARAIVTLTSIDTQLEQSLARLDQLRTAMDSTLSTVQHWANISTIVATLAIAWLAVGQAALCYLGWKGQRKRSPLSTESRLPQSTQA